ncbi:hypothetical protein MMC18_006764 [Xylographa bjoerkii]|nr:hypothetical protein [Xylographa bjoerkii]
MSQSVGVDTLFNGIFTLHRLSPLHHPIAAPLFGQDTLLAHSRRLKDALQGEVLRGVRVGLNDQPGSTSLGVLKSCHWRQLLSETTSQVDPQGVQGFEGIHVELEYETNTYTAFLLRSVELERSEIAGETHLPLLLTRMPSTVRDVLLDYLTPAFDVRIEVMRLSSRFMENTLEKYLEAARPQQPNHFAKQVKSIQLALGFKAPVAPHLRNLTIDIRREDVLEFLNRGKAMIRVRDNGNNAYGSGPFMSSIQGYIQDQTALNMSHGIVSISRLTCGAFVLTTNGKVKLAPLVTPTVAEDETANPMTNRSLNIILLEQLLINAKERLH